MLLVVGKSAAVARGKLLCFQTTTEWFPALALTKSMVTGAPFSHMSAAYAALSMQLRRLQFRIIIKAGTASRVDCQGSSWRPPSIPARHVQVSGIALCAANSNMYADICVCISTAAVIVELTICWSVSLSVACCC
jgi:hypothetical protein